VPDEIWAEAAQHYAEQALAAPIIVIATINAWNRPTSPLGRWRAARGDGLHRGHLDRQLSEEGAAGQRRGA